MVCFAGHYAIVAIFSGGFVSFSRPAANRFKIPLKMSNNNYYRGYNQSYDGGYSQGYDNGYSGRSNQGDNNSYAYTRSGCNRNGMEGANSHYSVSWGQNHPDNVYDACISGRQTNNLAHIQAAEHAIQRAKARGESSVTVGT